MFVQVEQNGQLLVAGGGQLLQGLVHPLLRDPEPQLGDERFQPGLVVVQRVLDLQAEGVVLVLGNMGQENAFWDGKRILNVIYIC